MTQSTKQKDIADLWLKIRNEVSEFKNNEPFMQTFFDDMVLKHQTLCQSIAHILAKKVHDDHLTKHQLFALFSDIFCQNTDILWLIAKDIEAFVERDPAVNHFSTPLLYFKGLHALSTHRMSHYLWHKNQLSTAVFLQNRSNEVFATDIHPAAKIGYGILIDHGTSLVIGETAVVGNNVSMLHEVTLGGNGKDRGDRHPKIGDGVLIGAGAKIIGNVRVGDDAKVGAGSVVLSDVACKTTVAGVPAKYVGDSSESHPALEMRHCYK